MKSSGSIIFEGYRLVKMDFECDPDFESEELEKGKYYIQVTTGETIVNDNAQINLVITISDKEDLETSDYKIITEIAGKFKTSDGSKWDRKWLGNTVAILFPYVRAIVGSLTSQSGRITITLPAVNIYELLKK